MHASDEGLSDSMKMFRMGVEGGKPQAGTAGVQPEWFYKGDGSGLVASGETLVSTAFARDAGGGTDLRGVLDLVDERGAIEVVVGLPRSLDGSEGPAAAKAREWATRLRSALQEAPIDNTPVRLVDERLTTVDAHRGLRDSGVAGRRQRGVVDQAAAVLILQTALDTERATGGPPGERVGRPRRRTPRKGTTA